MIRCEAFYKTRGTLHAANRFGDFLKQLKFLVLGVSNN